MAPEKSVKKSSAKKVKAEAAPVEPVPEAVPEVVTEETSDETPAPPTNPLEDRVKSLLSTVSGLVKSMKEIETELKTIKTIYIKETKENNKKKRRVKSSGNRMNGFLKQTGISKELAVFLGEEPGALVSRPLVTRAISKYVKEHNLASPDNKTIFKPDAKLKKLLGEPKFLLSKKDASKGNGYTYFNLQSYLKSQNHFTKVEA